MMTVGPRDGRLGPWCGVLPLLSTRLSRVDFDKLYYGNIRAGTRVICQNQGCVLTSIVLRLTFTLLYRLQTADTQGCLRGQPKIKKRTSTPNQLWRKPCILPSACPSSTVYWLVYCQPTVSRAAWMHSGFTSAAPPSRSLSLPLAQVMTSASPRSLPKRPRPPGRLPPPPPPASSPPSRGRSRLSQVRARARARLRGRGSKG